MAIPNHNEIGKHLLNLLKDKKEHKISKMDKQLAHHFELSDEEKLMEKSSGHETLFLNRIRWSNFYLLKAGLVKSTQRGYTMITAEGIKTLKLNPKIIDTKYLNRFPSFAVWKNSLHKRS